VISERTKAKTIISVGYHQYIREVPDRIYKTGNIRTRIQMNLFKFVYRFKVKITEKRYEKVKPTKILKSTEEAKPVPPLGLNTV
jgi:hypothetical protein